MRLSLILGLLSLSWLQISSPAIAQPTTQLSPLHQATSPAPRLPPEDQKLFENLTTEATQQQIHTQPFGQTMAFFARKLLNQPYVAGLLDQSPTEDLFLSLTKFDCVLFVESVMAIAHSVRTENTPTQDFAKRVQSLRYRNGQHTNYCSRLHYFSEWIDNNQARGNLRNLTVNLGGIPLNKQLQFMSRNRGSYSALTQADLYDCIIKMEDRLASLPMHYIPTEKIASIESQLRPGDIIAVATDIPYLDVTHTGLIDQGQGQTGLIHASPGGSVRLAPNLTQYVSKVESAIGIMVARPIISTKSSPSSH